MCMLKLNSNRDTRYYLAIAWHIVSQSPSCRATLRVETDQKVVTTEEICGTGRASFLCIYLPITCVSLLGMGWDGVSSSPSRRPTMFLRQLSLPALTVLQQRGERVSGGDGLAVNPAISHT